MERWYNKRIEKEFAGLTTNGDDSIVTKDVNEINMVRSFSTGVRASHKILWNCSAGHFGN